MNMCLTLAQSFYLQKIVNADLHRLEQHQDHAFAHGAELELPDVDSAKAILHEIYLIQSSLQ